MFSLKHNTWVTYRLGEPKRKTPGRHPPGEEGEGEVLFLKENNFETYPVWDRKKEFYKPV